MPSRRKRNDSGHTKPNTQRSTRTPTPAPQSAATPELIDPRWLLKALGIVFAVAILLAWGTLCLLWYQGQWQLVLHPSRKAGATPASMGLQFTDVNFAVDETGTPQLHGWLIPGNGSPQAATALFLHGADGSISDALPRALMLHNAGINVLLFDYRGYGSSTGRHPSESSMEQDAEFALTFLASGQHKPLGLIVPYGEGIGASLALGLAEQHPDLPAVILDSPDGDLTARVLHDAHSSLVPARLLFHDSFPLAKLLHTLSVPKLLITYTNSTHPSALMTNAAEPKMTVELPSPTDPALVHELQRFIAGYVYNHGPMRTQAGRWH